MEITDQNVRVDFSKWAEKIARSRGYNGIDDTNSTLSREFREKINLIESSWEAFTTIVGTLPENPSAVIHPPFVLFGIPSGSDRHVFILTDQEFATITNMAQGNAELIMQLVRKVAGSMIIVSSGKVLPFGAPN